MTALTTLRCIRCDTEYGTAPVFTGCERCARDGYVANLTPAYDYAAMREAASPDIWAARPRSMWRYAELLPVNAAVAVTLGEGGTSLVHLPRLGERTTAWWRSSPPAASRTRRR